MLHGRSLTESVTERILSATIPNYKDVSQQETRARYGYLEAWVSIAGNLFLFVIKYLLGVVTNSISLIADAFHTLSDVLTSAVVLLGFRMSARAPDKEHPFGHGRIESIATLIISVLLVLVGFEFLRSSIGRIITAQPVRGNLFTAGVLVLSGFLKEAMALFSISLGKRISSSALVADAWHHRSDAIASALVAVAMVAAMKGYHTIDAIFGLGVSGLIIYTGFDLGRSSSSYLIGQGPSEATVLRIIQGARSINGVDGVHNVVVHDYGNRKDISLHIEVKPEIDVYQAHKIASEVEKRVSKDMNANTTVHIEPNPKG